MQRLRNLARQRGRMCLLACALCGAVTAGQADAAIVVHGTRIVYPAERKEVTVDLNNAGDAPALVQVWIDAGEQQAPGAAPPSAVPFAVTPAIFRVEPHNGQSLRLVYTGKPLPTDRETVFWLNVLDIPPKAKPNPDAPNRLDIAFRHRMKLFFRPTHLKGEPASAAGLVNWSIRREAGGMALVASNPTPFDVSLVHLELESGGQRQTVPPAMLAPLSSAAFPLDRTALPPATGATVHFSFVDDFGAAREGQSPLQPGATAD